MNTKKYLWIGLIISLLGLGASLLFASSTLDTASVVRYMFGNGGTPHITGTFVCPESPTGDGNTGIIEFGTTPTGYSGATVVGSTFTGFFWIDAIGWVELMQLELFTESGASPRDPITLSGYAWSDSAGWIEFSPPGNAVLLPDTLSFSGYAWNDGICWINMSGAKLGTVDDGLVPKVKILGGIGGSRIFDTTYSVGESFGSVTMTTFIDKVRKNTTLLSRNAPESLINTDFSTTKVFENKILYINTTNSIKTLRYSTIRDRFRQSPIQSLIVIGGDISIDEDVLPNDTAPRAIIALKDATGKHGGNIAIGGNVKNIRSSLVSEGSIYSGYLPSVSSQLITLYNPDVRSTLLLPGNQLYIYGTVIARNTIGGAAQDGGSYTCPYTEIICTRENAVRYDLNFFRGYNQLDPGIATKRAYPTSVYDAFSMIIEYNPLVQRDPPPGLYEVR